MEQEQPSASAAAAAPSSGGQGGDASTSDPSYQDLRTAQSVDYSEATVSTIAGGGGPAGGGSAPPSSLDDSGVLHGGGGGSGGQQEYHHHHHHHHPATPGSAAGGIGSRLPADSTETVHEMHLALLYLLSDPDEFARSLAFPPGRGGAGGGGAGVGGGAGGVGGGGANLEDWNASYDYHDGDATDAGTDVTGPAGGGGGGEGGEGGGGGSSGNSSSPPPPLPYAVFAEDAEVVLPQAHTANQLFGLEREGGIELEAAAGIPALSQLFLRWLALMPDGDHMNIIDPPGLTVMRIAGGRYRCTAAHRVVWSWNSEFPPELFGSPGTDGTPATPSSPMDDLHMGDLVTMTIVDVFETDTDGRLLSYCPTFDNREVRKTMQAAEQIRKGGSKVRAAAKAVARSQTAARFNDAASLMTRMSIKAAAQVKDTVVKKIDDEMHKSSAKPSQPESNEASENDQSADEGAEKASESARDEAVNAATNGSGRESQLEEV